MYSERSKAFVPVHVYLKAVKMYCGHVDALSDRLGDKLIEAKYVVHCFNSSITTVISCQLVFNSDTSLVFRNGADGTTLIIEDNQPTEADLGEYGSTKLLPSSVYDPAHIRRCVGHCFNRYRIVATVDATPRAIELQFNGTSIAFYNDDDEFMCTQSLDFMFADGTRVCQWHEY